MKWVERVWAMMQKEMIQIARDKVMLIIAFVAPFFLTMLFGYIYIEQKVTNLPIVVYDRDQTELSRTIIRSFADSERFVIVANVSSFDALEKAISKGKAYMAVMIPPGLKQNVKAGRSTEVGVVLNGSNLVIINTVANAANQVIQTISAKITMQVMQGTGMMQQKAYQAVTALNFRTRVWYNPTLSYLVFMVIGLIGAAIQQVTFLGVALSFSKEREEGTWRQLMIAGMGWSEFVLGKFCVYFLIFTMDSVGLYLLGFGWFGVPMRGDAGLLLALTGLFIVVLTSIGMAISVLAPTMAQAIEISMTLAVPAFLISGYTWPKMSMPPLLQWLAQLMPLTHFLDGVRSIVLMGNGWESVWIQFFYLALFGAFALPLTLVLVKRRLELK